MGSLNLSQANNNTGNTKTEIEIPSSNLHRQLDRICSTQSETNLKQKRKCQCGTVPLIVFGLIFIPLGLLSMKFTLSDMILHLRIRMLPGYPPYDLWVNPQPEVRLNVYIFTVENAKEFLNGNDSNIKLKEIGPIVYREYLQHRDIVFHENSTLSYTSFRWAEFLPHANEPGILNKTITVPNFALLAAGSYVNTLNFFIKFGYHFIDMTYNEGLFINTTIYDYLWDYDSPLLEKAKELVPSMVPTVNSGILHGIYAGQPERYNVRIGPKYGDSDFFLINTVNGASTVPGYENGDCHVSVENSTEGALYMQRLTKNSVLSFWRKALCRTVSLNFEKEVEINKIKAYKYTLGSDAYDRLPNKEKDCFKGTNKELPNGLTDVSKCYFAMPFAASLPHFYGRSEGFTKKFKGLHPNKEKHECFTIVEPKIGVPLVQSARSQLNVVIPKFGSLFERDYQMFNDMVLPLFWLEFHQNGLTPRIEKMIKLFANVLPIIELTLTCILFLIGILLIGVAFVKLFYSRWKFLTDTNCKINFEVKPPAEKC